MTALERFPAATSLVLVAERIAELSVMVSEANTIDLALQIRNYAKTLETALTTTRRQREHSAELERSATALRLRAERRTGVLISEGQLRGEIAKKGSERRGLMSSPTTLRELGLTRDESSQFAKLAKIEQETFEAALTTDFATAPTRKALINLWVSPVSRSDSSHPAKFSDEIVPILVEAMRGYQRVLDPFAGTGRVHEAADAAGVDSVGIELEPEWAKLHKRTKVGNALALPFKDAEFDCLCTSPCYGNRLADHHDAQDASLRHSYTFDLGRALSPGNAGVLQWGEEYRAFHEQAWEEADRVVSPGGRVIINISDHIRAGERMPVTAWHLDYWSRMLNAHLYDIVPVETSRLRYGENAELRPLVEYVLIFDKEE
jgi:hypothetical protein